MQLTSGCCGKLSILLITLQLSQLLGTSLAAPALGTYHHVDPLDERERGEETSNTRRENLLKMKTYLLQFNYIPASPSSLIDEYDDDALEESLQEPIRIFQRFFRIRETGEVNEESLLATKRSRCGLGDPPLSPSPSTNDRRRRKRYAISGARWGRQELTFCVVNTPTYHVMPRRKVNWAIWNALKLWSSVIPVSFRKVPSWQPADIVIKFASYYHGDSHPFDGPNGTIAHAYLPNGRFGDLDGDIHLDDSEAFNNHGRWGYNLYKVVAHELGHSLGLDHSAVPGSIMVPDYQGFSEKPFALHDDDIRAIQVLYGFYDSTVQSSKPSCDKAYDATIMISGRLHIFKNNRVWMINKNGKLKTKSLGMRSKKLFNNVPSNIDGGYQRPSDGGIVIFKDTQYYVYSGSHRVSGYPRSVADYGLTTGVDSVLNLREYNKTYFFKDDQVWRFDENTYSMDAGYPHLTTSVFTGIVPPISSSFQYYDGYSYFVTGKQYQRYNPYHRNADPGYPRYFSQDFMKC